MAKPGEAGGGRIDLEDDADPEKFDQITTVRFSARQLEAFRRLARRTGVKPGTLIRIKALEAFNWERFLADDETADPKRK